VFGLPISVKLIIVAAVYIILSPAAVDLTADLPLITRGIDTVSTTPVDDVVTSSVVLNVLDVFLTVGDSVQAIPSQLFPNLFFGLSPKIVIENVGYSFIFYVKHLFYSCMQTTTIYPFSNVISLCKYTEGGIIKKLTILKDAFFVIKPHYTAQYFMADDSIYSFLKGHINMPYLRDNNMEITVYCMRNGYSNILYHNE